MNFANVQIPFRVEGERSRVIELSGIAAGVTNLADDGTIAAIQYPDNVVTRICYQQILLIGVARQSNVEDSTPVLACASGDKVFFYEFTFSREYLNSISASVTGVNQAVG